MVELAPLYRNQHTMSLDNTFAIEIKKIESRIAGLAQRPES